MAVTIRDVADATNVSPSTVSRVISDNPRISQKTKEKVRLAMKELGYHPNFIARSLANQSTSVIGVVFPSSGDTAFQNPFFTEVLRAISEGAHDEKFGIQLTTGKTEEEILNDVIQMVQGKRVDGLILLYSRQDDPIIDYLLEQNIPFVLVGQPTSKPDHITYVDNDNCLAAKEGTEGLIHLNHKKIAFIGGINGLMVTNKRLAGYKQALEEANIPIQEEYIIFDDFLIEGGKHAVEKLLALKELPTAVLVTDDLMAMGVMQSLNEEGLRIPEDVAILSFNNTIFSVLSNPPLSSVDIHIFDLGLEAISQLVKRIKNPEEPVSHSIIPYKIVIRSSC